MRKMGWLLLWCSVLCGSVWAETWRVGAWLPAGEQAAPQRQAMQLAVERFNAAHPGQTLELVLRQGERGAQELVQEAGLLAVVADGAASELRSANRALSAAGMPVLLPNSGSQVLLQDNPRAFMLNLSEQAQGQFVATYLQAVLKKDRVLLLYEQGAEGAALREAFLHKAERLGVQVVAAQEVPTALPADWVARRWPGGALDASCQAIVVLGGAELGLQLLPQLRRHGVLAPVMAAQSWADERFAALPAQYTREVYLAASFLWATASRQATAFAGAYQQTWQQRPPVAAVMAFDAVGLLGQAIAGLQAQRRQVSRATLRDFLLSMDWHAAQEGASGKLFFKHADDKTALYVQSYLRQQGAAVPDDVAQIAQAIARPDRVLLRDVFVAGIEDGRFKVASRQLMVPREEYVLKQLDKRIQKGFVLLSGFQPYHLVDVVFVGLDVVRINDINIREMQWDVDVFMWFKWAADRLDVREIEKISVINALKEQPTFLKEDLTGAVNYRAYRKRLILEAPYDLSRFPFDSQNLPLSIAHINKNATHIMLVVDARHMAQGAIRDINPHEWQYQGSRVYADSHRYKSTFGDPDYRMGTGYKSPVYFSTVNLEVQVGRLIQPYLYTFFLPLIILLGIILLVLWVPLDQFTPRINAVISGLVGILVYHMSQKNAFPKVGYTMLADYYFLLAYVFVVVMIIAIIYFQYLVAIGEKERAKVRNRQASFWALAWLLACYGALTLYAVLPTSGLSE